MPLHFTPPPTCSAPTHSVWRTLGPPSPASDDTIPAHVQQPVSAHQCLSSQEPALCAYSSPTAHSLLSPQDSGGAHGGWQWTAKGGALGSHTFWGGVSEFHHCLLSCCVTLGKLPDISEPWLPPPCKRGLGSCYLTHSLQEPAGDKCQRRRGIWVSICFLSPSLPLSLPVRWSPLLGVLQLNSPPPNSPPTSSSCWDKQHKQTHSPGEIT